MLAHSLFGNMILGVMGIMVVFYGGYRIGRAKDKKASYIMPIFILMVGFLFSVMEVVEIRENFSNIGQMITQSTNNNSKSRMEISPDETTTQPATKPMGEEVSHGSR